MHIYFWLPQHPVTRVAQFDYMLCEKAFPSVHLKSSPLYAVILEVPPPACLHAFVHVCVFSFDHIFACSHSSALTTAGETHKSSPSNFGIVEPDKDNFLFSFAATGEE